MKEHRDWFKYLKWLLIVLAGLGVLLVAALFGLQYYLRRGMTAAELAEMERFFSEPVEIPEEWSKVEPFPEEVILAAERLRGLCTEPGGMTQAHRTRSDALERLGRGEDLEAAEWKQIEESLREREEYLDALIELVSLSGYEMDAFPGWKISDPSDRAAGYNSGQQIAVGFQYLLLQAHSFGKSSDYARALDTCGDALKLLRHHPATTTTNHLMSLVLTGQACQTVLQLASVCDDAETLEHALQELDRISRDRNRCDLSDPQLLGEIGMLREYARAGEDVDLSSGQTRAGLLQQRVQIPGRQNGTRSLRLEAPIIRRILAESMVKTVIASEGRMKEALLASLPELDLARLALASRIFELRTGATPTGMDDLAPDYLPETLIDPFSKKPYVWSEKWQVFFSVGPNGIAKLDSMTRDEDDDLKGGDDTVVIPGQGIVTGRIPPPPRTRRQPR